jgi:adenylate cyclase
MRVGVLPFLASHLPMDETLASTASQEIAAALAKFQRFDVVPLAPSMSIPGPAPASRKSDELGELDYVVEGAVSSEGKHPQVSIRLLDLGAYARAVWSERTVLAVDKLRKWSELVATRVIGGIDPIVLFFDGQLRRRRRDGANGPLLLAIPLMHSLERRKYEEAGHLIDQALALEPDNAVALAWAAFWQVLYFGQGWTQDLAVACAIAQKSARAALELGSDYAVMHVPFSAEITTLRSTISIVRSGSILPWSPLGYGVP